MTELLSGTILKSRYKITGQLGQGGMGEVYLAEDQSLANQVAVKANHNLNAHASAQFIREARLLASLKHPNLPRVIDYFTEEDSQYLVMDYIPGDNLKTLIEKRNAIATSLVLKWAEQLGNAISYLHTQNPPIYHRDVKPANIKLTPDGEVLLVDFGIAKTGDPSQETQTGAWAYTPGFAPPEQVSGLRTGPYSDQFSLAATLYYLFAGKTPADSAQRMMGEEDLVSLKDMISTIPAHVSDAIDKALAIKPEARFSTVADFIAALLNPQPIKDPASAQQTVARVGPPKTPPPADDQPPLPDFVTGPHKRKKSSAGWIIAVIAVVALAAAGYFVLKAQGIIGQPASPQFIPTSTSELIVVPPLVQETTSAASATPESPAETPTATPEPSYIPVGRGGKVAFVSNRQADGFDQIWLMDVVQDEQGNLKGINPVQLTFTDGDKSKPAWSPDGTKLLFSGWSTDFSPNGTGFAEDIWVLDLNQPDAQPIDLSRRARPDRYAAWSPTGKKIVFTSYYRDDSIPKLIMMNPDGSEQTLLESRFAESYSTWSPNGDFLLFVLTTGQLNTVYMRDRYSLFKDFQKFDRLTDEGRLGSVSEPNLSLDGSALAYTRTIGVKSYIYLAPYVDRGKTIVELTQTGTDYAPFWSPDGKWLLFTTERDGNAEIYIMDRMGENETNLTLFGSQDRDPAWQPVALPLQ